MSKKIKLKIDELKVESFVTSLNDEEKKEVKGAALGGSVDCITFGCTINCSWYCHSWDMPGTCA